MVEPVAIGPRFFGSLASLRSRIWAGGRTAQQPSFEAARSAFETAWRVFLSKRTEADFQEWSHQRDWTAEKYRRFDRGQRIPHDWRATGWLRRPMSFPEGELNAQSICDFFNSPLATDQIAGRCNYGRLPTVSMILANLDFYFSDAQRRNDHVG
jgi:hypothetical protein